jgi:hypothetical protein
MANVLLEQAVHGNYVLRITTESLEVGSRCEGLEVGVAAYK